MTNSAVIRTFSNFRELLPWQQKYVLNRLTFKKGCLRRDLVRHNPPIALAMIDSIVPIGVATILPPDKRYKRTAYGLMLYVKPKYRRNGIGARLVVRARSLRDPFFTERCRWWDNSKFFERCFVDITNDGKLARSGR